MGRIEGVLIREPEIAVATSNGRAYYRIVALLKRLGIRYIDLILSEQASVPSNGVRFGILNYPGRNVKAIITTRKESLQLVGSNIVCIEDLGDDVGLAREKLVPLLYQFKSNACFVIGIDPGKRSGVAAFIDYREVESTVLPTMETTIERVYALIDNAPSIRKIVKIGTGNPRLAERIASILHTKYKQEVKIRLVNESGTSSLGRKGFSNYGTRDQRAAKMIAFREGRDFR